MCYRDRSNARRLLRWNRSVRRNREADQRVRSRITSCLIDFSRLNDESSIWSEVAQIYSGNKQQQEDSLTSVYQSIHGMNDWNEIFSQYYFIVSHMCDGIVALVWDPAELETCELSLRTNKLFTEAPPQEYFSFQVEVSQPFRRKVIHMFEQLTVTNIYLCWLAHRWSVYVFLRQPGFR